MGIYTVEGFGNARRKLSLLPVENTPEIQDEKPAAATGLGALTTAFLSSTTAHGLPRVVSEPSLIRKFAWLVIFVGATTLFSSMQYIAVVEYLNYPVEINIKYKVRTEAEFPAVTVCNLNALKQSKLEGTPYQSLKDINTKYAAILIESMGWTDVKDKKRNPSGESSSRGPSTQNQTSNNLVNPGDIDFLSIMEHSQTDDYSDIADLLIPTKTCYENYGHQANDFILQCSFDKTNCSYLDFVTVHNSLYGNCFVFNLNAVTTTLYGSKYGLRLTLNVEPEEYVGVLSHEVGVRVAVHPPNVTAFPEDEGVNAPTGYSTSIGVTTSTFKRLPAPYTSMCADGSNHTLLDSGEYTVWSCMLACQKSNMKKECGCSDMIGLSSHNERCNHNNATQEVCRQKIYDLYSKGQLGCSCPQPCNQLQYNSKVSMTNWPSGAYIPILWHNIGDDLEALGYANVVEAKDALVRVHVYMEDLTVQCTEEHAAFPMENLFANMGGYLGLFIGISICTVMEFFEFVMDVVGYAVITMCGGPFVRCVQQTKKKNGLLVGNPLIETLMLPPPEPMDNSKTNKKPRIIRVEPITCDKDVGLIWCDVALGLGFNPQAKVCW